MMSWTRNVLVKSNCIASVALRNVTTGITVACVGSLMMIG